MEEKRKTVTSTEVKRRYNQNHSLNGWLQSAEKPEIQADRISGFLFFGFKIFSTCCFNLQKILRIYIQRNKIVV
uniref:hypothetical protein n=1 Tax=Ruminococcus bromii TaxID=40518 RepID=UPI003FF08804